MEIKLSTEDSMKSIKFICAALISWNSVQAEHVDNGLEHWLHLCEKPRLEYWSKLCAQAMAEPLDAPLRRGKAACRSEWTARGSGTMQGSKSSTVAPPQSSAQ
jgi:hypothetical protein